MNLGNERPKCTVCGEPSFMLVGKKFYCGAHAKKASEYLTEQQEDYVTKRFKDDTKS